MLHPVGGSSGSSDLEARRKSAEAELDMDLKTELDLG